MDGGIELTFNSNFLAAKGFLKVQFSMKKKKKIQSSASGETSYFPGSYVQENEVFENKT